MLDEGTRAEMRCGFLDPGDWVEPTASPPIGYPGNEIDVSELEICPGWLVRLPVIEQAAKAVRAFRKGALHLLYPGNPNPVIEAALDGDAALESYEAAATRAATKEAPK